MITDVIDLSAVVLVELVGLGSLLGMVGILLGGGFRMRSATKLPPSGAVLAGLSLTGVYLFTVAVLTGSVVADLPLETQLSGGYTLGLMIVCGATTAAGARIGDRVVCRLLEIKPLDGSSELLSTLRKSRLTVELTMPATIDDADGYHPISADTRDRLAASTLRLPAGLDTDMYASRIEAHLKDDFGVDYAHVTVQSDGCIETVAVGVEPSGLGTTLPPDTACVAVQTHNPTTISHGDQVEIWSQSDESCLITTGVARTTVGSLVSVTVPADAVNNLDSSERYQLVVSPDQRTDASAFMTHLREVPETIVRVELDSSDLLSGEFTDWVPGRVIAIQRDSELLVVPSENETVRAGDTLWIVGSPEELAALESLSSADVHTRDSSSQPKPVLQS